MGLLKYGVKRCVRRMKAMPMSDMIELTRSVATSALVWEAVRGFFILEFDQGVATIPCVCGPQSYEVFS